MKKNIFLCIIIVMVCIFGGVVIYKHDTNIVARYSMDMEYRYCPVEMNGNLYFPSSHQFEENEKLKNIGFLGPEKKGFINDLLLNTGAILVDKENVNDYTHFTVRDDNPMTYSKSSYLNELVETNLNKYDNFVICTDSNGKEIRKEINKDILVNLYEEFGVIKSNIDDYKKCSDIYFIYVNDPSDKIHDMTFDNTITYMATIFVEKDKLYYGNLKNEIKGKSYEYFKNLLQI